MFGCSKQFKSFEKLSQKVVDLGRFKKELEGLSLFKLNLELDGLSVKLDIRDTYYHFDLIDDYLLRDFGVNSVYLFRRSNQDWLLGTQKVSRKNLTM